MPLDWRRPSEKNCRHRSPFRQLSGQRCHRAKGPHRQSAIRAFRSLRASGARWCDATGETTQPRSPACRIKKIAIHDAFSRVAIQSVAARTLRSSCISCNRVPSAALVQTERYGTVARRATLGTPDDRARIRSLRTLCIQNATYRCGSRNSLPELAGFPAATSVGSVFASPTRPTRAKTRTQCRRARGPIQRRSGYRARSCS
jgi:hypothetical protein